MVIVLICLFILSIFSLSAPTPNKMCCLVSELRFKFPSPSNLCDLLVSPLLTVTLSLREGDRSIQSFPLPLAVVCRVT